MDWGQEFIGSSVSAKQNFFHIMSASDASQVGSVPGPNTPGGEVEQIAPFAWPSTMQESKPPPLVQPTAENAPDRMGTNDSVSCLAEALRDNWERVKDVLKRQFGEITDEDFLNVEQLEASVISHIREKTGRSHEEISDALHAAVATVRERGGDGAQPGTGLIEYPNR
jgi:DNA-binding transcriptional regulator YiaG